MITTGFWCDDCRRKYVRHMCKARRLPCGHSYQASFAVECQAFGGGNRQREHVYIEWGTLKQPCRADVWIDRGDRPRSNFVGSDAFEFWGLRVTPFSHREDWEMWVGEWLASKPDAFVRAYLSRWDSSKWVPEWLSFREHPDAKRACALEVRK